MGPTGVGKSSVGGFARIPLYPVLTLNQFINKALGQDNVAVAGHGLKSCTAEIRSYRCQHADGSESNVVLIDTPGFDDTEIKDADILAGIAQWLKKS
jgi:predicted GTPase